VLIVRKQFNVQAVAPLIYNLGTIVGGILLVHRLGVSSLAIGTVPAASGGAIPAERGCCWRWACTTGPFWTGHGRRIARMGQAVLAADDRRVSSDGRQLDIAHFASGTSGGFR